MMTFDEPCGCGGTFTFTADDVARGMTVICSRGCKIELEDGGGAREMSEIDRLLDNLGQ